jgi:hypothetical protein
VRRLIWLAAVAVVVWVAATVPIGGRTLFEHIRYIGHADSLDDARARAREVEDDAKAAAKPVLQKAGDKLMPELPDGDARHWQDRSIDRYRK